MCSVPEGRAANQPLAAETLTPPRGAPFAGAAVRICSIFSPASSVDCTCCADSFDSSFFCSGVAGASRRHLGRQQAGDQTVLVRGPDRAGETQKRGSCALLTDKTQRAAD